jgi:hypothetical protein
MQMDALTPMTPPPVDSNGVQKEFLVSHIVDAKYAPDGECVEMLAHWLNFPNDSCWVPFNQFDAGCKTEIAEYLQRHSDFFGWAPDDKLNKDETVTEGPRPAMIRFWGHCDERNHHSFAHLEEIYEVWWSTRTMIHLSLSLESKTKALSFFDQDYGPRLLRLVKQKGWKSRPTRLVGARARPQTVIVQHHGRVDRNAGGAEKADVDRMVGCETTPSGLRIGLEVSLPEKNHTTPVGGCSRDIPQTSRIRKPFTSTTKFCVMFAFFKLCVYVGRPLSCKQRKAVREQLKTPLSGVCVGALGRLKGPWQLAYVRSKHRDGRGVMEWVIKQTSGFFLLADHHHCVAVDTDQRVVLDSAEDESVQLPLTSDVLVSHCNFDPVNLKAWRVTFSHLPNRSV